MRGAVRSFAVGVVLVAGAFSPAVHARPDAPASSRPVLGVVRDSAGLPDLARLDPATLRPLSGPRVRVFDHAAPSMSPDGTRAVLGNAAAGSLTFVDVRRMRRLGYVWINPDGPVAATAWPSPRRVLAAIVRHRVTHASSACCNRVTLVAVDPATRKVVRSTRLTADPVAVESWRGGLVLVLAPPGRVGAARLAVVGPTGRVRTVGLARMRAGRNETARRLPGLAVDPARARAFVVGAGEPIAEVDLRTLSLAYHQPDRSLAVRAKDVGSGPARLARWLGDGLLAVSGEQFLRSDFTFEPAGLVVVDTATWRVRTIDPTVSWFSFGAGLLVGEPRDSLGLRSWTPDGQVRFGVFAGRLVARVEIVGERAFVSLWGDDANPPPAYSVVDLRSGAIVSEVGRPLPTLVAR